MVRDLSSTGLLFQSDAPFAVGEQLRIVLPRDVVASAKIVWKNAADYGCEFESPLSRAALSAALLKGEPQQRLDVPLEKVERWPAAARLALIVAGSALLWGLIILAVMALR